LAPGGAVVDGQRLLYSVGNGESTTSYDGSDSVVALSPTLTQMGLFAPSTWPQDNQRDLDLGSSNPTLVGGRILAIGKRGIGYVLQREHFGGVGGQLSQVTLCRSFGGSVNSGGIAYVPCTDGTRAIRFAANGTASVLWRDSVNANGSPTIGAGVVWVVNYTNGTLFALDQANGTTKAQLGIGAVPHFASPTLSGNHAYIGTTSGVVAVSGV
jgi:polyvinyl alcohol dehydrogenase (cytochrome)